MYCCSSKKFLIRVKTNLISHWSILAKLYTHLVEVKSMEMHVTMTLILLRQLPWTALPVQHSKGGSMLSGV